MLDVVYAKFSQNPALAAVLDSTGECVIVEIAPWDTFWGTADGVGHNYLGITPDHAQTRKVVLLTKTIGAW